MGVVLDTFGERLKQAREEAGMSQEALAEALGVVRRTVAGYEAGTKSPRLDRLPRISEVLRKPPGWFLPRAAELTAEARLERLEVELRRLRGVVARLARANRALLQRVDSSLPPHQE